MEAAGARGADVVVVGAGVGGLAAAVGLRAGGHRVRVLERSPALRTSGTAVTLTSGGTAALSALGVPVQDLGRRVDEVLIGTGAGATLLRMDAARVGRRLGHPMLSVPRGRLVERLAAALPAGAVVCGAACTGVEERPDGRVRVRVVGAAPLHADVVVGADGTGSVLRHQLWSRPATRATGWTTWQGCTPVDTWLTASNRVLLMTGPEGFCDLQPAGDGLLQWSFSIPARRSGAVGGEPGEPGEPPLAMLRRRFGGWAAPVPEVLDALDGAAPVAWTHRTHAVPRVWGAGRTTLVGDAAHTMPPSLGQGVNQALEDARALAAALAGAGPGADGDDDVPALLRRYERRRSRRVRAVAGIAGSELPVTDRLGTRLVMRALPERVGEQLFTCLVRGSSAALAGARRPHGAGGLRLGPAPARAAAPARVSSPARVPVPVPARVAAPARVPSPVPVPEESR